MSKETEKLIDVLERKITYYQKTAHDDPYNTSNAVIAVLSELVDALRKANE